MCRSTKHTDNCMKFYTAHRVRQTAPGNIEPKTYDISADAIRLFMAQKSTTPAASGNALSSLTCIRTHAKDR